MFIYAKGVRLMIYVIKGMLELATKLILTSIVHQKSVNAIIVFIREQFIIFCLSLSCTKFYYFSMLLIIILIVLISNQQSIQFSFSNVIKNLSSRVKSNELLTLYFKRIITSEEYYCQEIENSRGKNLRLYISYLIIDHHNATVQKRHA